MSATAERVVLERRGTTALVTVNRPEARNAMTFEMYDALHDCCEQVDNDPGLRALVVRGGNGNFAAGTDIAEFRDFSSGEDGVAYERRLERIVTRVETVAKPTIAMIEGHAVGGGLAIAAACDLRVCTPEAKFGMPIARTLGNCLSVENIARLVALIGAGRTKELIFTARSFSAQEALAAGLATAIARPEELEASVLELAERIGAQAPLTLRATKEAIRRARVTGLPESDDLVSMCYGSEDFREGVAAFNDRRRPVWRGA